MKISKIYKKGIKTYEDIFGKEHHKICEGINCVCHTAVKSFIKDLTLNILKAEIERLGGKRIENKVVRDFVGLEKLSAEEIGYNNAIQDQIDYYQEQIKEINQ